MSGGATAGHAMGPLFALGLGAMAVLVLETLALARPGQGAAAPLRARTALVLAATTSLALIIALALTLAPPGGAASSAAGGGGIRLDGLATASVMLVLVGALLCVWLSGAYLAAVHVELAGYHALLLLCVAGSVVALTAESLIVLWVGLELVTTPLLALTAFDTASRRSNEAALKTLLAGAFGSVLLLYGISLLYGATGHLDYAGIRVALDPESGLARAGIALVLAGLAVKAALAPFHQWAPDAWEGAPTSVTTLLSVATTATVLLALARMLDHALPAAEVLLRPVLWALAAASILLGSAMAILQDNLKRLLAWASVAHAGWAVMAIVAGGDAGRVALIFYLLVYVLMHVGAFAVVVTLAAEGRDVERIDDLSGLGGRRPALAAALALFMLALAGVPGTAGFFARIETLGAAIDSGAMGLAAVALIGGLATLHAYLRVPVAMYMREGRGAVGGEATTVELAVIGLCALAAIGLGVVPNVALPGLGLSVLEIVRLAVG